MLHQLRNVMSLAAVVAVVACNVSGLTETPGLDVVSMDLTPANVTLTVGDSLIVGAYPRNADGVLLGGRQITWTSTDTAVARVSPRIESAVIRAHTPGTVEIAATVEGRTGTASVTVVALEPEIAPVSIVRITGNGVVTIYSDEQHQLGVRTFAADGTELFGRGVSWTSTNNAIANVNQNGRVIARAVGSADVTATVEGQTSTVAIDVRTRIIRVGVFPGMVVLGPGEHEDVTATLYDANHGVLQRSIVWTSSNQAVATVEANGRIHAHSVGTAIIKPTAEGQEGWVDVRVVEWVKWNLLTAGDSALPATLYTRTTPNPNGGSTTTRTIARQGDLRMILVGANSGRFQFHFHVGFENSSSQGQMIYGGTYHYDVQNTIVFQTYGGQTLTGRRFTDGRIVITGKLEPNTSDVTLTYRQP